MNMCNQTLPAVFRLLLPLPFSASSPFFFTAVYCTHLPLRNTTGALSTCATYPLSFKHTVRADPLTIMEQQSPNPSYTIGQAPPLRLQTISDFMREQEMLDGVKSAELKARAKAALANSNPKKFKKAPIDVEAVAAEARGVAEIGETNWTGRLLGIFFLLEVYYQVIDNDLEYRNAHPTQFKGLIYNESPAAVTKFRCSVKILESEQTFGDSTISFTKKKDAKQYASKKAIDWLIENKYMPADGSVKFPKPVLPPSAKVIGPQVASQSSPKQAKGKTFASQVPELCLKLGFNVPKYEITRVTENAPLFKGYAHFQGDPRIEGNVGEVSDVFGQRNAKEKIAEEVVSFLKDIERQRGDQFEEEDKKRKRSSDGCSELEGTKEKSVKLE